MLIGFCAFAYEFDGNTYLSGAADFDLSYVKQKDGDQLNYYSFGIDANCAYYLIGNLGAYASVGYNYNTTIKYFDTTIDSFKNTWIFDGSVGLAYKFNIAKNQQLAIDAGFAFWQWTGKNSSDTLYYSSLGISTDVMYRIFMTDNFYFVGGAKGTIGFGVTAKNSSSTHKFDNTNIYMVRPYIGIGGRI